MIILRFSRGLMKKYLFFIFQTKTKCLGNIPQHEKNLCENIKQIKNSLNKLFTMQCLNTTEVNFVH